MENDMPASTFIFINNNNFTYPSKINLALLFP